MRAGSSNFSLMENDKETKEYLRSQYRRLNHFKKANVFTPEQCEAYKAKFANDLAEVQRKKAGQAQRQEQQKIAQEQAKAAQEMQNAMVYGYLVQQGLQKLYNPQMKTARAQRQMVDQQLNLQRQQMQQQRQYEEQKRMMQQNQSRTYDVNGSHHSGSTVRCNVN